MSAERSPLDVATVPLSGVQLIEASAGTGKTYTITSLYLRALVELGQPLEKIAAVTFTNAATSELRERVARRLIEAREALAASASPSRDPLLALYQREEGREGRRRAVEKALVDVDRAAIFTIHGFAQRLLGDFAFETGARYEVELLADQSALVYDATIDFWSSRVATLEPMELRALGGEKLFNALQQVAKVAAASPEVPLVEVEEGSELSRHLVELERPYREARQIHAAERERLLALLDGDVLKRNVYRREWLEADAESWRVYFSLDEPEQALPRNHQRWGQTKIGANVAKRAGATAPRHRFFELVDELSELHTRLAPLVAARADRLRSELADFVRRRVAEHHERALSQSFDDLLSRLRDVLRHPTHGPLVAAEVRRRYPLLLIDEFQDTDPIQYEIFRRIYVEGAPPSGPGERAPGLFLIGDPKQSIYSFRGADVHAYLEAARGADRVWTLTTSYRAGPSLIKAQNALFGRVAEPFATPGIRYEPVVSAAGREDRLRDPEGRALPGLAWLSLPEGVDPLEQTAREVAHFLAAGCTLDGRPVRARHLAVLTRSNAQALEVQRQLTRRGVPAVMHGDRSVFEQPEALELRRVLLALAEPSHGQLVRAALATRLLGLDAAAIHRLDVDDAELERWTGLFRARGEDWQQYGLVHALERLEREVDLAARTLRDFDGERRLTNYRHLVELLHEAEVREHLGQAGLIRTFESAIVDPMGHEMAAESKQLRLDSDEDAVTLTTIHKSKGLEYDVVFLAHLGEIKQRPPRQAFRFHRATDGAQRLEVRGRPLSEEHHALAQREDVEEALRLSYVALTRARDHVVALVPPPAKGGSPLYQQLRPLGAGDWAAALSEWTPELFEEPRAELERAAEGSLEFRSLRTGEAPRYERPTVERPLQAAPAPSSLPEGRRTSSFSSMTRHGGRLSRSGREGRDIDEQDRATFDRRAVARASDGASERVVLADYPRGAGPGDALHLAFEKSDFAEGTAASRWETISRALASRGIAAEHVDAAARGIEQVLATPLGEHGVRLGELTRRDKRPELEFALPVASAETKLSGLGLARALGYGRTDSTLAQSYLAEVARLGFGEWWGFLRGFVDLVFEAGGRFYVVDYKSNYLGDVYGDYDTTACERAMREHHYPLQACLYALALHRHLRLRYPGYDYERHFGEIHYLFVRGMRPGADTGIYTLRPSREEIERLSAAFETSGLEGQGDRAPRRGR